MKRNNIAAALARLAPAIPVFEQGCILDHAMDSTGLRTASPEEAAWLSLVAYVRHEMTDYDELLDEGYDAETARHFVADAMRDIIRAWGVRRAL